MKKVFLFFAFIFFQKCYAAPDTLTFLDPSPTLNRQRLTLIKATAIGLYPISMYWLYSQWYKDYPQSKFHFFNDAGEWKNMDKAGHLFTSYTIGKACMKAIEWAGVEVKKAVWYGAGIGFVYQTTIETFDGFSSQWGFSVSDIAANSIGSALLIGQELAWNEQRVRLKFSFHQTKYSMYRTNVLGSGLAENFLKDYNGQTYWLSVNPFSFMSHGTKFPRWLSVALGYGAEGMTGAYSNPSTVDGNILPQFDRYNQYYAALDIDLSKVQTHSKFLSAVFKLIGFIRLPSPAIEFNSGHKTKVYALYF